MNPGLLVKCHPLGPWRPGPDSGGRDRVDLIYHSDTLYSAVTGAMHSLDRLEDWLDATARAGDPGVRFSSCFPFLGDRLYAVPPRSLWPPAASPRVRWRGARFVPLTLVSEMLAGSPIEEERWAVDGGSECLVPAGSRGPFGISLRSSAAVDRWGAGVAPYFTACLEFVAGAGLWAAVSFADLAAKDRWSDTVRGALRLLGDSGFGGERTRGWGRCEVEFRDGDLPDLVLPPRAVEPPPALPAEQVAEPDNFWASVEVPTPAPAPPPPMEQAYWLLSLFVPSVRDAIDWQRGNYSLVARHGRIESPERSGDLKLAINMITEGSVLLAPEPVRGAAPNVAPEGFPHPVFRAGFAMAIPIPAQVTP